MKIIGSGVRYVGSTPLLPYHFYVTTICSSILWQNECCHVL